MNVSAYLERERKKVEVELKDNATVKDLLHSLKINFVTVVVTVGEDVVTEDYVLHHREHVEIHSVVSGG